MEINKVNNLAGTISLCRVLQALTRYARVSVGGMKLIWLLFFFFKKKASSLHVTFAWLPA